MGKFQITIASIFFAVMCMGNSADARVLGDVRHSQDNAAMHHKHHTPVKDAQAGADGQKAVTYVKGDRGDKGDHGEKGARGDKGENGDKGDRGERGHRGEKGDKGEKGERGSKGELGEPGLRGLKGDKGEKGEKGIFGEKGEPGLRGLKGDKGDRGEKGGSGEKGEKGDKGSKGSKGVKGEDGAKGVKGSKGDRGPKGKKGSKGDRGLKGEHGKKGKMGKDGLRGKNGKRGRKGKLGPAGTPGTSAFISAVTVAFNASSGGIIPISDNIKSFHVINSSGITYNPTTGVFTSSAGPGFYEIHYGAEWMGPCALVLRLDGNEVDPYVDMNVPTDWARESIIVSSFAMAPTFALGNAKISSAPMQLSRNGAAGNGTVGSAFVVIKKIK